MSKKFLPTEIYFGNVTYNLGEDGYYFSATTSFLKIEKDNEILFKELKGKGYEFTQYKKDTPYSTTVNDKICLADMMPKEKINTPISTKLINLYLLKYTLLSSKKEKKIYNDYAEEFKKKNSR